MEPIIINETLTAPDGTQAPLRIVVYDRYSRFINSMHSLVSPSQDHKWYIVAEVGAELSTEEFFGGPMAVFEGITWTRHTLAEDYQPLVDELKGKVTEYLADRFPADGVRKSRFEWEPLDITPMPVDLMQALHDELAGTPEEEFSDPLPFDGPVQDDTRDDEAAQIAWDEMNRGYNAAEAEKGLPTLPPFNPGPLKFFDDSSFDDDTPSSGTNLALAMIPDDSPLATASYEERKAAIDPEQSFYENRKETLGSKRAGRFIAQRHATAKKKAAATAAAKVIDLNQAGGKPLPSINSQMVNLTFDGPTDAGALHRAIVIARDLCRLGHWDGVEPIRIADPYAIYNRVDQFVTCRFEAEYGELVVRKAETPQE